MEVKEKHLDQIQAVITRHNTNSFMIKGWTITISTAVFTLAGMWKEPILALVALVPIIVFWALDSFYLANERCFVSLYKAAINDYSLKVKNCELLKKDQVKSDDGKIYPETEVEIMLTEYSMNYMSFKKIARNNWQDVIISRTIIWFYLMLIGFSFAIVFGLMIFEKPLPVMPIKISAKIQSDSILISPVKPYMIINNIILNDSIIKKDTIKK